MGGKEDPLFDHKTAEGGNNRSLARGVVSRQLDVVQGHQNFTLIIP